MNEAVKRIEEGKKVRAKAAESALKAKEKLMKIEEEAKVRAKAAESALKAKEKLMKIEEEAKATKDALATQKAEIEAKARALVLEKRDAFSKATTGFQDSTKLSALLGKSQNINALKESMKAVGQSRIDKAQNKINKVNLLHP